jgi:hypothetical protein
MTGADHEQSAAVILAAQWYATQRPDPNNPTVPLLRERFGLTPLEACLAIAEARLIRMRSL